jgi:beta-lactam-binding protein with PASTA domain
MKNVTKSTEVTMSPLELAKIELEKQRQIIKDLKAKEKAEKKPREKKGTMVRFTNKAGETIEGLGNLYYVVSQGGKLHYKAVDAVEVLKEI